MDKRFLLGTGFAFGFDIEISDMLGSKIPLSLNEEKSKENDFVFTSKCEAYELDAFLKVEKLDSADCVKVGCKIRNLIGYDAVYTLAAYDSIKVTLYPENDPKEVFGNYFHIAEKTDCWSFPFFCDSLKKIKGRTVSLLFKDGENYHQIMPLASGSFKTDLKPIGDTLGFTVSPYCGGFTEIESASLIVSYGSDPYRVAENTVTRGFEALGARPSNTSKTRLPELFGYIGWCSWDSLTLNVNSSSVYKKAEELKEKDIPVKWILIDDGWFPENKRREMLGLCEIPEKFPEGFKDFITKLKKDYGMKYVGIWECESGDWFGIEPGSELAKSKSELFTTLKNGYVIPRPDEAGSFLYWNEMHRYMSSCGFDFVKIDTQCNIEGCTTGAYPIGDAASGIHRGIEGSVGLYFDGACINCTGMAHTSLWNRAVGSVSRNSEDFRATDIKTMSGFINENIYNSFYHSHFCATDWDMMWSVSETTDLNVVLHAISGGPVYFSDPLGLSDRDVIMPFCLSDGRLLKCDGYANPTRDRLFRDPQTEDIFTKGFNRSGDSAVIGLFNTNLEKKKITDSFRVSDAEVSGDAEYLLYDRTGKSASVVKGGDEITLTLDPDTARLYIASPFISGIAVLGDADKYVCPAVIEDRIITESTQTFILSEGGRFSFASKKPVSVTVNGVERKAEKNGELYAVDCTGEKRKTVVTVSCF